jgi:hypothetical protein
MFLLQVILHLIKLQVSSYSLTLLQLQKLLSNNIRIRVWHVIRQVME